MIDRHFKLSDVDKIFGTLPMNIKVNTVILATKEITYRNRKIGPTLALAEVRCKLYYQMIKEILLAKFPLDRHNCLEKWDVDSYRFPTG